MPLTQSTESPRYLRLHEADNVAVIVNDGGVSASTAFGDGLRVRDSIPQAHKVALRASVEGEAVLRYGQVIGVAWRAIPEGSWVQESDLVMPTPPALDSLPRCTDVPPDAPPLEGYTFEGYKNADGSVGTRNLLGITTTVQCVTGVLDHAVKRIRDEVLPRYPNVDGVVALSHDFVCVGSRSTRPMSRSRSAPRPPPWWWGMQCGGSDAFSGITANRPSASLPTCWCAPARR